MSVDAEDASCKTHGQNADCHAEHDDPQIAGECDDGNHIVKREGEVCQLDGEDDAPKSLAGHAIAFDLFRLAFFRRTQVLER
jgi:hypothetical protein